MGGGSFGFTSSSSRDRFPSWSAPFTRWAFTGNTPEEIDPRGNGLISDALMASNMVPNSMLYGGLGDIIANAQMGGLMGRQLTAGAMNQGYGNLMTLAGQGWGPLGNTMNLANLVPQAMDASNYFLNRGVTPAMQGTNVQGAMGAGQQVVDAALGAYRALPADAYRRVVQEGLPEVRASYGARGLGLSGEAARGEQDYIQRTRDQLHQQDVANQIAALQAGANASSAAASQAIGAQQAAIGRGNLGLNAAAQIPQMMGGFQDVNGSPLGYMAQFAGLQGLPLNLVGQGINTFSSALGMPLQFQSSIYDYTRGPQLDLLGSLAGLRLSNSRSLRMDGSGYAGAGGGGGN